jgi:hypothetical protein
MKGRIALGIVAASAAVFFSVKTSHADPDLQNIPPHRHYVKAPDGSLVEVGPRVCDDPHLQRAFNQFHNNIHTVSATGIGPAAPGLHNFKGADMSAGRC